MEVQSESGQGTRTCELRRSGEVRDPARYDIRYLEVEVTRRCCVSTRLEILYMAKAVQDGKQTSSNKKQLCLDDRRPRCCV